MTYEIVHYGVPGMKWGVRRSSKQLAKASGKKGKDKDPVKEARKQAVKNRRTLKEGDIDALVQRIQKEQKLKQLVEADVSPGRALAKNILGDSGQTVAKRAAAGIATAIIAAKFGDTVARGKLKGK